LTSLYLQVPEVENEINFHIKEGALQARVNTKRYALYLDYFLVTNFGSAHPAGP